MWRRVKMWPCQSRLRPSATVRQAFAQTDVSVFTKHVVSRKNGILLSVGLSKRIWPFYLSVQTSNDQHFKSRFSICDLAGGWVLWSPESSGSHDLPLTSDSSACPILWCWGSPGPLSREQARLWGCPGQPGACYCLWSPLSPGLGAWLTWDHRHWVHGPVASLQGRSSGLVSWQPRCVLKWRGDIDSLRLYLMVLLWNI